MTQSPGKPGEPTNGEIKALLVEHMRASAAARVCADENYARIDQKLQTVVDDQIRLRTEVDRLKSDTSSTDRIAKGAALTAHDLQAVVVREFATIATAQTARGAVEATAQASRTEETERRFTAQDTELAKQTKALGALLMQISTVLGIVKATPAVVGIIAVALAGLLWLVQHAH
jgi:hypothetical protein